MIENCSSSKQSQSSLQQVTTSKSLADGGHVFLRPTPISLKI